MKHWREVSYGYWMLFGSPSPLEVADGWIVGEVIRHYSGKFYYAEVCVGNIFGRDGDEVKKSPHFSTLEEAKAWVEEWASFYEAMTL